MLLNLREYHRPLHQNRRRGLDHALELLSRPDIKTVPLAGGDTLLGRSASEVEAVVDLQGLDLDTISLDSDPAALRIGAMVTRSALADSPEVRALYCGVIAQAARRWGGNVQRNRATVGGALATAAGGDPLVTALLACGAGVVLYGREGDQFIRLADYLPQRDKLISAPAIIVEVVIPEPEHQTGAALTTVARTPADAPIVLAVAALTIKDGVCLNVQLALGGIAETPILVPRASALLKTQSLAPVILADAASEVAEKVHPTGDFRGSAEYRRAMVEVLTRRALNTAVTRC